MTIRQQGQAFAATCTGEDCGQQYADEESGAYLFTSREGLERHLHADRWQADPVLCPACQPDDDPAPDGIPGQLPLPGVA